MHGVCGIWGTLSLGLFATGQFGAADADGRGQLGGARWSPASSTAAARRSSSAQAIGSAAVTAATFVVGFALMYAVKATGTLRVSRDGELEGLDIHEHGGPAYPELIGSTGMHGAGAAEGLAMKAQPVPAKAF